MKISDIVRSKGDEVVTIGSDRTVRELLALLDEHRIGAVVVSDGDGAVDGIVSERDIVRHLHAGGPQTLSGPVSAIMTGLPGARNLTCDNPSPNRACGSCQALHVCEVPQL